MIKLHEFNLNSNFNISRGRRDYCPISKKDAMNPPVLNYLDTISNTEIFLSQKNIHYMTYYIINQFELFEIIVNLLVKIELLS